MLFNPQLMRMMTPTAMAASGQKPNPQMQPTALIYFAQLARLARTIRETDETGLLRGSVPGFLNFMHILMIIPLLGGVTVILASGRVKEFLAKQGLSANLGFMDILTTLLGAVLLIVLFIAVRTLKRNLKNAAA